MSSPLLQVDAVSKTYPRGQRPAVHAVSFTVGRGEFVSLVGESGSGKTTLLRLIAGLETADAGTLALDGALVAGPGRHAAPEERGIGLVFQHHALFPHLTVSENVSFGLRRLPRREREDKVAALLALVGLPDHGARYPHELSGGERQRVALARALAPDPKLLLLDEPFSSLDTHLRESLRDDTRRMLREHGTTAILVTHHTRDALAVSDHIAVLRHGDLEQAGTPEEIYHAPATPYVASLFGPCNFLPSQLSHQLGAVALGTAETLWVRPESLSLKPATPGQDALVGEVTHVSYGGDCHDVALRCALPDGGTASILVCHHGGGPICPGERWAIQPRMA